MEWNSFICRGISIIDKRMITEMVKAIPNVIKSQKNTRAKAEK